MNFNSTENIDRVIFYFVIGNKGFKISITTILSISYRFETIHIHIIEHEKSRSW